MRRSGLSLADKSRQGHTAEVKELLAKYGADKLSEVDASKYAELKAEAEGAGRWLNTRFCQHHRRTGAEMSAVREGLRGRG